MPKKTMTYEKVKNLNPEEFKRFCGVYPEPNNDLDVVVVDVAEHEIERPQKKQKSYYSSKQGYHTLKSQVVANQKTRQIICTAHEKGKVHDFKLGQDSQICIDKSIECLADKGYQGIQKNMKIAEFLTKRRKINN